MKAKDMNSRESQIKRLRTIKIIEMCITFVVVILAVVLYVKGYDPTVVLVYLAGKNIYSIKKRGKTSKNYTFLTIINVAGLFLGFLGGYNLIQQLIK